MKFALILFTLNTLCTSVIGQNTLSKSSIIGGLYPIHISQFADANNRETKIGNWGVGAGYQYQWNSMNKIVNTTAIQISGIPFLTDYRHTLSTWSNQLMHCVTIKKSGLKVGYGINISRYTLKTDTILVIGNSTRYWHKNSQWDFGPSFLIEYQKKESGYNSRLNYGYGLKNMGNKLISNQWYINYSIHFVIEFKKNKSEY